MIYFVDKSAAEEHVQLWHHGARDLLAARARSGFKVGICVLRASSQRKEKAADPTLIHMSSLHSYPLMLSAKRNPNRQSLKNGTFFWMSLWRPQTRKHLGSVRWGWEKVHFPRERQGVSVVLFCSSRDTGVGAFPRRFGLDGLGTSHSHQRHWHLKWWAVLCWKGKALTHLKNNLIIQKCGLITADWLRSYQQ